MEFNQTIQLKPIYANSHFLYNAPVISATMPSLSLTSGLNIVSASSNRSMNTNGSSNNTTLNGLQNTTILNNSSTSHHQLVPVNSGNVCLNNIQIQQLQMHNKPSYSRNHIQTLSGDVKQMNGGQLFQIQLTNPTQLTTGMTTANNEIPINSTGLYGQNISNNSSSAPDTTSNQSNESLSSTSSADMGAINNIVSEANSDAGGSKNSSQKDTVGSEYVDLAKASCSGSAISMKLNPTDNINFSISYKSASGRGFKCEVCNRDFTQKGNLKTHRMTHSGERPYVCQSCGKNFTQKGNLDTHVKIHTETKDHRCQFCDRGFTQRGNLKTHIRSIHTKEKPFACGHCGKAFSQRGNMLTHFRTHDKEARFPCNVCGKTFSQKGNLKTHQQRHGRNSER